VGKFSADNYYLFKNASAMILSCFSGYSQTFAVASI